MTYPIAGVALVSLILSGMLLFVVPQFKSIYAQLCGSIPLPTTILLVCADVFKKYWYIVLIAIFGGRFFLRRWKATPKGREAVDAFKLRVPVFGSLFRKPALARFA